MNRSWFGLGVREPRVAEAFGVGMSAQLPMRARAGAMRDTRDASTRRSWWMSVLRVARNALIAAVAMAAVPLVVVVVRGDRVADSMYSWNANARARTHVITGRLRSFGVASDPSITPMQAGIALNDLQYRRSESGGFTVNTPATHYVRPWRVNALTPDMFPTSRPDLYDGPSSRFILEASVKGFSPRELAYLKAMAEAPIWREFDLVARAPAVDIAGGQLRLPLDPEALPEQRPMPSYRDSRDLANASVARAAYYMAIGQPARAEEALRSVISFGFALIDNGSTSMDELIGTVIAGIGRDGLQRFYVIEHDPRASLPALAGPTKGVMRRASALERARAPKTPEEVRRQLLATLVDPTAPRSERFEAEHQLTMLQCTSARGLLFGQRDDVSDAIERARTTLARYPSERALIDLGTRLPSTAIVSRVPAPIQSLIVSPAIVAGTVLHNPRMGACTLLLTSGW